MAVTERTWCDFVSYDPRLPADLRLFVQRLYRHDTVIELLEREVGAFLAEVDALMRRLEGLARQAEAA
jgi:hypothetical protein